MSSKLSARRETPLRPPVCKSKDAPIEFYLNLCQVRIIWTDQLPTPHELLIDQTVQLESPTENGPYYVYLDLGAGPGELVSVELFAPLDPAHNLLAITGKDLGGATHLADATFSPPQLMPFNQTVELSAPDYPEPGSVIAHIAPVKK